MRRLTWAGALVAVLLLAGCGEQQPQIKKIEIAFRGDPYITVRGFWIARGEGSIPEKKTEISAMVPNVLRGEAPGVKFFNVRKLTDTGTLLVYIYEDGKTIFEGSATAKGQEVIFNERKDRK